MSVTKSSAHNATILAHAFQDATDPVTKETVTEKAVWMLQKQDTGGVLDNVWKKISDSGKEGDMPAVVVPFVRLWFAGDNTYIVIITNLSSVLISHR